MIKNLFFIKKIILVAALGLIMAGCATHPPVTIETQEAELKQLCDTYKVAMQWDSTTQVIALSKNGATAMALVGSNMVVIGDEKIALSGPVRRSHSRLLVPADFKRKVIDRLGARPGFAIAKFREIIIDAGHGGKDPGARGRSGLKEKTVVLDIAKRLKKNLEEEGIKVIMTRGRDEFISLKERTEIACRSKADLFISVHANSSRNRGVQGVEVYYLRDLGLTEKRDPNLKDNRRIKFRHFNMTNSSSALEGILTDMMESYKQSESRRLSFYLSKKTPSGMRAESRGSKSAGFFVLRNTLIPAILVEVGFLSNSHEEKLLNTGLYRQKVADSIAKGILDYAGTE
jgi:N-acetylmuramoyl-L-alanine amidase